MIFCSRCHCNIYNFYSTCVFFDSHIQRAAQYEHILLALKGVSGMLKDSTVHIYNTLENVHSLAFIHTEHIVGFKLMTMIAKPLNYDYTSLTLCFSSEPKLQNINNSSEAVKCRFQNAVNISQEANNLSCCLSD